MEKDIACFCKKKKLQNLLYLKLSIHVHKKICSLLAILICIRRIDCYVICLIIYSGHFIWEETYISNITSFPALSVFMYANV